MLDKKLTPTLEWDGEFLYIIDQTKLPTELIVEKQTTIEQAFSSIKELKVRGAPAIGIAGAYSLLIGIKLCFDMSREDFLDMIHKKASYLDSSRPTAVNLSWALKRMTSCAEASNFEKPIDIYKELEKEAIKIHEEDIQICRAIGEHGVSLLQNNMGLLTHCNAGGLATSELGTALAPIYVAYEKGMHIKVYADETRPLLQGARLTSFELHQANIDVTLICDNMAAFVMSKGLIDIVIVGCDRVARNGDVANKIGTMGVAILAKHFNIPVYIACPSSTFDFSTKTGDDIVIEERDASEIIHFGERQTAPSDIKVRNPAFDITPHNLITGFITEYGIIKAPFSENLQKIFVNK